MIDLKRLATFREVARLGSFSAAASELSYTQPAVSQQISVLEEQTGARLLDRTPKGIRLTSAGEALLRHAERIFARVAEAEAELEAISGLRGGRVRLESFPTGGSSLIPAATATFRARYPEIELVLTIASPNQVHDRLRAGDIDIALIVESGLEPTTAHDGFDCLHVLDDPMHVVLPAGHPLADCERLHLEDLAEESWLLDASPCPDADVVLGACMAAGFSPRVAIEHEDYAAIQGFVAAGVGVSLVPELALQGVRDDIVVRSLSDCAPVRKVVALTNADAHRPAAVTAVLEVLQETAPGLVVDGSVAA
jgi:DNA-binding transcriptional LysR family regulator